MNSNACIRLLSILMIVLITVACATLPEDFERPDSYAYTDTDNTHLGRAIFDEKTAHPGKSGFLMLGEALIVLAFINGIMMVGRAYAGSVAARLSTAGMLWFSAIFSFIGLWLLAYASGYAVFAAAAVFAVGITFFWPTTLSFVSENMPESGAFGLSIMGGLGMLSVSVILPVMGRWLDDATGPEAILKMSLLPAILIVAYGALFFSRRNKAGVNA